MNSTLQLAARDPVPSPAVSVRSPFLQSWVGQQYPPGGCRHAGEAPRLARWAAGPAAHSFGLMRVHESHSSRIQGKLLLGQPTDHYEQEADAIADKIVASSQQSLIRLRSSRLLPALSLQSVARQALEEEPYRETAEPIGLTRTPPEEEDGGDELGGRVQAKALAPSPPLVPSKVERAITASAGSGNVLPQATRNIMEPGFGADFSTVRVHADSGTSRVASAIHARAFTLGRDIFFGPGEYQPHAPSGLRLLAHELTHVLQQTAGGTAHAPARAVVPAALSHAQLPVQRTLSQAFTNYRGTCDCGENLGNNCAHYLSDSLIRSGYATDLDGGTGSLYRRRNGRVVCKSGRPVRAMELSAWFASQATDTNSGEPDSNSHWAVYQERASDGQGHVNIHSHTGLTYTWSGTGDYPTWRTQNHYSF